MFTSQFCNRFNHMFRQTKSKIFFLNLNPTLYKVTRSHALCINLFFIHHTRFSQYFYEIQISGSVNVGLKNVVQSTLKLIWQLWFVTLIGFLLLRYVYIYIYISSRVQKFLAWHTKASSNGKMLWGIYSAIYGEVNVSVEKCVEIKGDYVEK